RTLMLQANGMGEAEGEHMGLFLWDIYFLIPRHPEIFNLFQLQAT
ncbi:hypothetical protein MNBD_ALPHA04-2094, partial [hydrothermal vent metagenome]